jgi:hypothetical protein
MAEANHCGSCTMCCKLLDITVLKKPRNQWCPHCAIGKGCTIYDDRPAPCRSFVCLWLGSQTSPKPLPPQLRPDRSGVVFYYPENYRELIGLCDPASPGAWKTGLVQALLRSISKTGRRVMLGDGKDHFAMDGDRARPIELGPPDAKGIRSFARFLD